MISLTNILFFVAGMIFGAILSFLGIYLYIRKMMKKFYDPKAIQELLEKFLPKQ